MVAFLLSGLFEKLLQSYFHRVKSLRGTLRIVRRCRRRVAIWRVQAVVEVRNEDTT
jgi:hypothetical protein